ncbi:MAG: carbohydrate ABC transporter permease [Clostridia bacterium]|nr:carbohydrate ABC transporter permease [Clostridia bacterium]
MDKAATYGARRPGRRRVRRLKKRHILPRLLLTLLALIILLPVFVTGLYSFFSPEEIKAFMETRGSFDASSLMEVKLAPDMFSLSQYYHILIEDMTILRYFVNSAMYAGAILLGQALLIPMMAYALSRFRFPGRDALFFLVIMLMLLPFQVTMVPNVLTLRSLGLLDTVWAIILPMAIQPFYIFLVRQYMVSLPSEMIGAAQIDGAGTVRCFFHLVLPVCKPILGCAAALSFADCWNLVEQPLTYLTTNTQLYPLSVVFNQLTETSTGVEFAGAALYTLPALLIYLFFQEDILTGVQLTELK